MKTLTDILDNLNVNSKIGIFNLVGLALIFIIAQNIYVLFFYLILFLYLRVLYKKHFSYMWSGLTLSMIFNVFFIHMAAMEALLYQDSLVYMETAYKMAFNGTSLLQIVFNDQPVYHWVQSTALVRFSALLYALSDNLYIMSYFNFTLYFLSVSYVLTSTQFLFDNEKKVYGLCLFLLFFPPAIYINSILWKESILLSMILILFGSLVKKKFLVSTVVLVFIWIFRDVYIAIIFILLLLLIGAYLYNNKRYARLFGLVVVIFLVLSQTSLPSKISSKTAVYTTQAHYALSVQEGDISSFGTMDRLLNRQTLVSVENIIFPPIIALFNNMPIRFVKVKQFDVFIENIFVSLTWLLGFPFAIIGIFNLPVNVRRVVMILSLAIYLASAYSAVSMSPEVFRYRLPIYGLFGFLMYYGLVQNKVSFSKRDQYIKVSWYTISFFAYMAYTLSMVV